MGFLERAARLREMAKAERGMGFENRVVAKLMSLSGYKYKIHNEYGFTWLYEETSKVYVTKFTTRQVRNADMGAAAKNLPRTSIWREFLSALRDSLDNTAAVFFAVGAKIYVVHNLNFSYLPSNATVVLHRGEKEGMVTLCTIETFFASMYDREPLYDPTS